MFFLLASLVVRAEAVPGGWEAVPGLGVVLAEAVPGGWQAAGSNCASPYNPDPNGNMCNRWGCCNVPSLGGLSWCEDTRKGYCTRGCQFFQCTKTCPYGYYCAGWNRCQNIADKSCITPLVPTKRPTPLPTTKPRTLPPTSPSNPWNPLRDCEDLLAKNSEAMHDGVERTVYPFNTGKPGDRYADFGVKVTCRLDRNGKAATLLSVKPKDNYSYFEQDRLANGWECVENPQSWQLQAGWSGHWGETKFSYYTLVVDRKTDKVSIAQDADAFLFSDEFKSVNSLRLAPGSGGSCYSWNGCAASKRGRFSMDLTGTGLAFAESVKWKATGWGNGQQLVLNYDRTPYKASGKCGAWCGSCAPDGELYLIPDPKWTPPATPRPTSAPTRAPTKVPSRSPTFNPTTLMPTSVPTAFPTNTQAPTSTPTEAPTPDPTDKPTMNPTGAPSLNPTMNPTGAPSFTPTTDPTEAPSFTPTTDPTETPSFNPTAVPTTRAPTHDYDTSAPTRAPTRAPTTSVPTRAPTTSGPTSPPISPWNPMRDCQDLLRQSGAHTLTADTSTGVRRTVYPFNNPQSGNKWANFEIEVTCRLGPDGKAVTLVAVEPEDNFSYFAKDRLKDGWECVENPEPFQLQAEWDDAGRTEFSYYALIVDRSSDRVYLSSGDEAFLFEDEFESSARNLKPGTAGSCYSWNSCAASKRGEFRVDLAGTGLALADSVKWKTEGWGSTPTVGDFERTATKASGKCGAWCGSCAPEGDLLVVPSPDWNPSGGGYQTYTRTETYTKIETVTKETTVVKVVGGWPKGRVDRRRRAQTSE